MRAVNNEGEGADSNTATATPAGVPEAIFLLASAFNAAVRVEWIPPDANGSPITKYQLRYRVSGRTWNEWTDITPLPWHLLYIH